MRELPFPDPNNPIRDIYVVNSDGTGETNLTKSAASDTEPACSPDGRKIVSEREVAPGNHEIFTMNADGGGVRRLTVSATAEGHPSFSPPSAETTSRQTSEHAGRVGPFDDL